MSETKKEQKEKNTNSNAEKPISLAGPKFEDVVKALLETKPAPKDEEKDEKNRG